MTITEARKYAENKQKYKRTNSAWYYVKYVLKGSDSLLDYKCTKNGRVKPTHLSLQDALADDWYVVKEGE
jgi:hypothetical protein